MKNNDLERQLDDLLSESIAMAKERAKLTFDRLADPFADRIILFGAGGLGRRTLAGLLKVGIEPLAFADNNPKLWKTKINGINILSPVDAAQRFRENAVFIVTIWGAGGGHRFEQTQKQLQALGCRRVIPFVPLYWKYANIFLPYYGVDLPHKTLEQADTVRQVFTFWADGASRKEYLDQVRWRLWFDFKGLLPPVNYEQYFPSDLFRLSLNDCFVDCGAYNGDTLQNFLKYQNQFVGKVIAIEPDPINYKALQEYITTLPAGIKQRITTLQFASGDYRKKIRFTAEGKASSGANVGGALEVECVPLDELLKDEAPTFIKMDIEGDELASLIGAQETLRRCTPLLAICVYHRQQHLWQIPNFIHPVSSSYRFFLRPHNEEGWDLVCYAIPGSRLIS